jgi:hypothetical protein
MKEREQGTGNREQDTPNTQHPTPEYALPPYVRVMEGMRELLQSLLEMWRQLFGERIRSGRGTIRPWTLTFAVKGKRKAVRDADVNRLLQRHRDLKDVEKITTFAKQFRLPESDFFGDPQRVEQLIRRILEENPPWLYVSRELSGGEQGSEAHSQEFVWREQEIREYQPTTLYIPDDKWRDMPLSSITLRPARNMHEVWQSGLLNQILPSEVLVDRLHKGEVMISNRDGKKHRLEFKTEERIVEIVTRKQVPVPIEIEGGSGKGGQLLYILLDYSASMQGKSATLAMAVIAATLRANMGQAQTRYLFRRYAQWEELWPLMIEPPVQARTLQEKDSLLDTILATNFNGGATHVNHAVNIAIDDILHLRHEEHLEAALMLVTDGRAEIMEGTRNRIKEAGVTVHTIMVTSEANTELAKVSDTYTTVDLPQFKSAQADAEPTGDAALLPKLHTL